MEQIKVTQAERKVLKAMGRVGTYIHPGDWRRTNAEVINTKGMLFQFRRTTLINLLDKGLLSESSSGYKLTALGGEAAIKGYYTPGGDAEQRGIALKNP